MARVLLTTIYDQYAIGLRTMAACLLQAGHEVRLCFLETEKKLSNYWEEGKQISPLKYMVVGSEGGIALFDGTASPISDVCWELYAEEIKKFSPQIIGFGIRSYFDDQAPEFLRRLRIIQPQALIVCGGFGPSFNPEHYLREADYVVRGDGEEAIVALAHAVDHGYSARDIPNVCYFENKIFRANRLRAPVKSLDSIPFPHYGSHSVLVSNDEVFYDDQQITNYVTLAGRGCLGKCTYCAGGNWSRIYAAENHKMLKRRRRSMENLMEELRWAKKCSYTNVTLADEHFAAPLISLIKFFEEYKKEIALPLGAYLHTGQIVKHPEIVSFAAEAGLVSSCVGIQSGSEDFCRKIYKRHNNNEEILKAAYLLKSHGIKLQYHIIMGNPLEQRSDIEKTFELVKRLPPMEPGDVLGIFRFTPLPGAPIWKRFALATEARTADQVFLRDALLCQLRIYLDDDEFEECRASPFFKKYPLALQGVLKYFVRRRIREQNTRALTKIAGKTIAVWGTGGRWREIVAPLVKASCGGIVVDCFVDNDRQKQGTVLDGKPIIAPNALLNRKVDAIIIATCFVDDVVRNLCKLGLNFLPRYAI